MARKTDHYKHICKNLEQSAKHYVKASNHHKLAMEALQKLKGDKPAMKKQTKKDKKDESKGMKKHNAKMKKDKKDESKGEMKALRKAKHTKF